MCITYLEHISAIDSLPYYFLKVYLFWKSFREKIYLPVYTPDGHNVNGQARPKPGSFV